MAFNRAKALLVVCFVGPSMTKCVFSYHPLLLLLCLDGTDFALILVFFFVLVFVFMILCFVFFLVFFVFMFYILIC